MSNCSEMSFIIFWYTGSDRFPRSKQTSTCSVKTTRSFPSGSSFVNTARAHLSSVIVTGPVNRPRALRYQRPGASVQPHHLAPFTKPVRAAADVRWGTYQLSVNHGSELFVNETQDHLLGYAVLYQACRVVLRSSTHTHTHTPDSAMYCFSQKPTGTSSPRILFELTKNGRNLVVVFVGRFGRLAARHRTQPVFCMLPCCL